MLPIIFELNGQKISIFAILLAISLTIYLFTGWVYLRRELETRNIFDILFISVINYLLFSRIFGVLENISFYSKNMAEIFNFRDNNFSFIGLFIGLVFSIILINKFLLKQHRYKRSVFEHLFLIIMISIIPVIIGNLLSGRMLGVEVPNGIGLLYENGIKRMPIAIFRILFFIIALITFRIIIKDKSKRLTNIIAGFFMGFAAFEFVINIFTMDYAPTIWGIINIEQLGAVCIFILGTVILLGKKFSKIAYDEQEGNRRKSREELLTNSSATDYSYSFRDMNISINQSELSIKEKFRILINSIKRKLKK